MDSLRIIEIYYNTSRNKNYFKERDRLIIDGVLSPSIKSIHISELYPKQLFYLNVNIPAPIRLTRGTTKIPKVFEYAVRYKCFRDIFEDKSFLEIALDTDNHTFFEDEWFIKAFEKLINYFDKQTIKPQKVLYCVKDDKEIYKYWMNGLYYDKIPEELYTKISNPDVKLMSVESYMTFKTLIKISKSFIKKSTVSQFSEKLEKAFDNFETEMWKEYSKNNELPF